MVRKELWETVRPLGPLPDNIMFVLEDGEDIFGLKPMNCPRSMLIFRTRLRSYRDLPLRLADTLAPP